MTQTQRYALRSGAFQEEIKEKRKKRKRLRNDFQHLRQRWTISRRQLAKPGLLRKKEQEALTGLRQMVIELSGLVEQAQHLLPEAEVKGWAETLETMRVEAAGAREKRMRLVRGERD